MQWEGGVRAPFILRWRGHVPAGRVDADSVLSGVDWLPTVCALAGVALPHNDFDDENALSAWLGKGPARTVQPPAVDGQQPERRRRDSQRPVEAAWFRVAAAAIWSFTTCWPAPPNPTTHRGRRRTTRPSRCLECRLLDVEHFNPASPNTTGVGQSIGR
jgi:arylsulfatase A-like enzyme